MKKSILLIATLLITGCESGSKMKPETCNFCEGFIFWHQVENNFLSSKHGMQYEKEDGKFYHKWCYKFRKDEKER